MNNRQSGKRKSVREFGDAKKKKTTARRPSLLLHDSMTAQNMNFTLIEYMRPTVSNKLGNVFPELNDVEPVSLPSIGGSSSMRLVIRRETRADPGMNMQITDLHNYSRLPRGMPSTEIPLHWIARPQRQYVATTAMHCSHHRTS